MTDEYTSASRPTQGLNAEELPIAGWNPIVIEGDLRGPRPVRPAPEPFKPDKIPFIDQHKLRRLCAALREGEPLYVASRYAGLSQQTVRLNYRFEGGDLRVFIDEAKAEGARARKLKRKLARGPRLPK